MQFYAPNNQALEADRAKDAREAIEQDGPKAFYLKPGVTQVRILPPFSDRGVWYREISEYSFVSDGQRRTVTAPTVDMNDPVAEKRQALLDAGGDANIKLAKDLKPRRKFLFNVLVWSAPPGVEFKQGQVYVLKAGVTTKRALLDLDRDAQGGWADITNPQQGVNLRITRKGTGLNTEYSVSPMPQRTDLAQDLAAVGVNINDIQLYDLDALYPPKDPASLVELVHGIRADVGAPGASAANPAGVGQSVPGTHATTPVPVAPVSNDVAPVPAPAPAPAVGGVPQATHPATSGPVPSQGAVQPVPSAPAPPPAPPAPPQVPVQQQPEVAQGGENVGTQQAPPVPPAPPTVLNRVNEV